jgi:cardiolipin synthase
MGFVANLHRSLLDSAKRLDQVSLAVTGLAWLGAGVPSVQQEAVSLVQAARFEVTICAYSITSGANPLLELISQVANQGVTTTLLLNDFYNQALESQRLLLNMAHAGAGRIRLFNFRPDNAHAQLHAKVLVVDRNAALIGSANLSFHGMVANHELAVVIKGPTTEEIAARLDSLKTSCRCVEV